MKSFFEEETQTKQVDYYKMLSGLLGIRLNEICVLEELNKKMK